jgi:2'-5' RNA ligase
MGLIPELFSIRPEDLERKRLLEEAGIHADFLMTRDEETAKEPALYMDGPHEFSSTQFDLPEGKVLDAVKKMALSIPDGDLAGDGREKDFHVTVKYGLHTDDAVDVKKVVDSFGPVSVRLGKISLFPANESQIQRGGEQYDVVKIDVDSENLHRLNNLVSDSLECTDTHPDYKPHITLAYVKPGAGKKYVGEWEGEEDELSFNALRFSSKDGNKTTINL